MDTPPASQISLFEWVKKSLGYITGRLNARVAIARHAVKNMVSTSSPLTMSKGVSFLM